MKQDQVDQSVIFAVLCRMAMLCAVVDGRPSVDVCLLLFIVLHKINQRDLHWCAVVVLLCHDANNDEGVTLTTEKHTMTLFSRPHTRDRLHPIVIVIQL